jgi:hypothetical protein
MSGVKVWRAALTAVAGNPYAYSSVAGDEPGRWFPEAEAAALEAVAEAVADDLDCFASQRVKTALDDLDAARRVS